MPIPAPPAPPPKKDKNQGTSAVFQQYIRSHGLGKWSGGIWKWAKAYGIDPVYYAALIWFESGGNPHARSGANALGLAQIYMPTWNGKTTPWGEVITPAKANNPAFALRWGAWYFAQNYQKYGTYDAAYRRGYNGPHYTGESPFGAVVRGKPGIPKTYTTAGGLTIGEKASVGAQTTAAGQQAKGQNPYLQGQAFIQAKGQLDTVYEAYTGKASTIAEAREALSKGWSTYHLQVMLSERKSFIGSPVWKSFAPGYQAMYRSIYGNVRAPNLLISYAIVHNLGSSFADTLRQGAGYVKSQEFKQNTEGMANVYRKIFGEADENGMNVIKRVTLAGWNPDQFADYLRKQPGYVHSNEFRTKANSVASVFGNVQTLSTNEAFSNPDLVGAPTDSRIQNYEDQPVAPTQTTAPVPRQKKGKMPKPQPAPKSKSQPKPQPPPGKK